MANTVITPPETGEILNISQVARLFGVGEKLIHRLTREGRLPAFRVGCMWRYSREGLLEYAKQQGENNLNNGKQ